MDVPGWGGVKGGISHGATDELGFLAMEDPVSVHDLHATMLYLMGSTTPHSPLGSRDETSG